MLVNTVAVVIMLEVHFGPTESTAVAGVIEEVHLGPRSAMLSSGVLKLIVDCQNGPLVSDETQGRTDRAKIAFPLPTIVNVAVILLILRYG